MGCGLWFLLKKKARSKEVGKWRICYSYTVTHSPHSPHHLPPIPPHHQMRDVPHPAHGRSHGSSSSLPQSMLKMEEIEHLAMSSLILTIAQVKKTHDRMRLKVADLEKKDKAAGGALADANLKEKERSDKEARGELSEEDEIVAELSRIARREKILQTAVDYSADLEEMAFKESGGNNIGEGRCYCSLFEREVRLETEDIQRLKAVVRGLCGKGGIRRGYEEVAMENEIRQREASGSVDVLAMEKKKNQMIREKSLQSQQQHDSFDDY